MSYYGLHVPDDQENFLVVTDKWQAINALKSAKNGRVREFPTYRKAFQFAHRGDGTKSKRRNCLLQSGDPPVLFRRPSKDEIKKFLNMIHNGDYRGIKKMIWTNPRYLITIRFTPTIVDEKKRYNCLHVCAIRQEHELAELILKTVSDSKFVDLLYGEEMCSQQVDFHNHGLRLLDYYLNMPEERFFDTPLHLAAVRGDFKMVRLLMSFPQCKMSANHKGLYPKDIICLKTGYNYPKLHAEIRSLLEERFYVPVLRYIDKSIPPKIGQPFTCNNTANQNCNPFSPGTLIEALAGPMNRKQAMLFYNLWKTPLPFRSNTFKHSAFNTLISSQAVPTTNSTSGRLLSVVRSNKSQSMNNLASFSNETLRSRTFSGGSTRHGSELNLTKSSTAGYILRHIKIVDTEKGYEVIGRALAKEHCVDWGEYWDFLNSFINIATDKGLQELENFLTRRLTEVETSSLCDGLRKSSVRRYSGLTKRGYDFNNDPNRLTNNTENIDSCENTAETSHYSRANSDVEKSLQSSVKKMIKTIESEINKVECIRDTFISELRNLDKCIFPYKNDARFARANLAKAHSRIGNLISYYIENGQDCYLNTKLIIQGLVGDLIERYEQLESKDRICPHTLTMIKHPFVRAPPELPQNEKGCVKVWENEEACGCRWEMLVNGEMLCRIPRYHDNTKPENIWKYMIVSDRLQSDYMARIQRTKYPQRETYEAFIFDSEPTKRDVDVYNAIGNVHLSDKKHIHICAWKEALLRFYNKSK